MRAANILGALGLALGLLASPAWSATVCYDESAYPVVAKIVVEGERVQLVLGNENALVERPHPVVSHSPSEGWKLLPPLACHLNSQDARCLREVPIEQQTEAQRGCAARIPQIPLTFEEYAQLRPDRADQDPAYLQLEQVVGSCVESGPYFWFGIRFYAGEGITGAGGFGRMLRETAALEVRRPSLVAGHSVDRVLHDGSTLYIATGSHHECIGDPPAEGLLAYHWEDDRIEPVPTCGKVIHDVQLVGPELWVGTDMGLSIGRLDPADPGSTQRVWTHYEPRPELAEPMRESTCAEIYAHVLESPRRFDGATDYGNSTYQLIASGYGSGELGADLAAASRAGQSLSARSWIGGRAEKADLRRANLAGADLRGATLGEAQLDETDLSRADLRGANLIDAGLAHANLAGSDLRNALLDRASLAGANLEGADLRGAASYRLDLSGVRVTALPSGEPPLSQAQLDDACGDATTRVPASLEAPPLCTQLGPSAELLKELLAEHRHWLESEGGGGRRADLRGAVLGPEYEASEEGYGLPIVDRGLRGAVLRKARLRRARLYRIDLEGADLGGADLGGATLDNARLSGADFREATLAGASFMNADLSGALLPADGLDGINLYDARLGAAQLKGARLRGANLASANLDAADLEGADLEEASVSGAELRHASLKGARLARASLRMIEAEAANLAGATLVDADLGGARLASADLTGADLSRVRLAYAKLSSARLAGARLDGANLTDARLPEADLRRASLTRAVLEKAELERADLTEASLDGANLRGAELRGARLDGARFAGADLTGARGLEPQQLTHACGDAYTLLPAGLPALPDCTAR